VGEGDRVALLVPNLFLRVPVETAARAAGSRPFPARDVEEAAGSGAAVVIADLEALGRAPAEAVRRLVDRGQTVLAFGPHVEGEMLAAARAAGAVVLPRSAFLERLPELLSVALRRRGTTP
jgi:hypothetical protein